MQKHVSMLTEQVQLLTAMKPGPGATVAQRSRWQEMKSLIRRQVDLTIDHLKELVPAAAAALPGGSNDSAKTIDPRAKQAVPTSSRKEPTPTAAPTEPKAKLKKPRPLQKVKVRKQSARSFSLRPVNPLYAVPPKVPELASLSEDEGSWRNCYQSDQQCIDCTLGEPSSDLEPCRVCHSCPMVLRWPDNFPRTNPTLSATMLTEKNETLEVYVKFPCIPTSKLLPAAPRVDPHGRCAKGLDETEIDGPARHVMSIQRITDECGLDGISARYWVDNAISVVENGPFVNQKSIYAQTAPGIAIEKIRDNRKARIRSIPVDQILEAALHDFILCEGDRHQGNIYLDDDNNIMLIDNDRALGNKASMTRELLRQGNLKCQPSSLFLPSTMESNRLHSGELAYLDYRCHVGEDRDLYIPPTARKCLQLFASMHPEDIQEKYDILYLQWAEDLHSRAKDLLELGFWEALLNAQEHAKNEWHRLDHVKPKPTDPMFPHWRGAFWRPLKDPNCGP